MEKYFEINQDGSSIQCKLYYQDIKNIDSVIIFGHGFAGHKDNKAAEKLADRVQKYSGNTALFIFDWPGHGDEINETLKLSACMKYLNIVIEYVRSRFRTERIFGCATSFGGYLYLKYISDNRNPFVKTVLRCPAINMYEVLTEKIMTSEDLESIRKGRSAVVGFDRKVRVTTDFILELKENDICSYDYCSHKDRIAIIHGTKDEIVSFDVVKHFAEKNEIPFIAVDSADHRFTDPRKMDEVIYRMIDEFSIPQ